MDRLKVMTIVGTRPEIIRLSRVMLCLDEVTDHVLVHTGQNYDYELNEVFFEDLGLRRPDVFLDVVGTTLGETIGNVIARSFKIIEERKPDAVLILGDTNSCLAALAAKRLKIPVFHMEAGNRCFDFRVPEEINRRIVDHVADINLPYSDIARGYLLREGLPPDRVVKTGSPMYEVLTAYRSRIDASQILMKLALTPQSYFLVSCHREENVDDEGQLRKLLETLNAIAGKYGKRIIVSSHPRTRKRLEALQVTAHPLIEFHKPFAFSDYVKLEKYAHAVLSDSGTITEESSILNFRALNIREAHERPEGMEESAVMLSGLDARRVLQCLEILERQTIGDSRNITPVRDYLVPNVSEKVLRIIASHIDFVRRVVWQRN
jgi:UDP-N-acetylglucosamine 2-epimerase (non-hydrolysing)